MTTAFCRALAAVDEREDIRGRDTLAELFLTEEGKKPIRDPAESRLRRGRLRKRRRSRGSGFDGL